MADVQGPVWAANVWGVDVWGADVWVDNGGGGGGGSGENPMTPLYRGRYFRPRVLTTLTPIKG